MGGTCNKLICRNTHTGVLNKVGIFCGHLKPHGHCDKNDTCEYIASSLQPAGEEDRANLVSMLGSCIMMAVWLVTVVSFPGSPPLH